MGILKDQQKMEIDSKTGFLDPPRVLMVSQRNLFGNLHYRLGLYEFEDIICQIDSVNLLTPRPKKWFEFRDRIANRLASVCKLFIDPGISRIKVENKYDLFFAIAQFPNDLVYINNIKNWKQKCKTSICWLNEMWISDIPRYSYIFKILSEFDYIVVHLSQSLEAIQKKVRGKCIHLPYGIDSIFFCPYPNLPKRVIDVYSIGRKSLETHSCLMEMIDTDGILYLYDTINGENVYSAKEHRFLFANAVKRSRYFIVNPGRKSRPDITKGQSEFGNRFFEGAAAGAIMIGEKPDNREFDKYFDWSDAVIDVPFGSKNIGEVIRELDKQPKRQHEIRKNNVAQSLLRHDWAYRWESVLEIAGLDPLPGLLERKERLNDLANSVKKTVLQ